MSSLSEIWSLDKSTYTHITPHLAHLTSTTPAPAEFTNWFVSHICMNRYSAHYLAILLDRIPSSETRLRNDGIIAMYNIIRGIHIVFIGVAQQRRIAVPDFADIPVECADDARTDYDAMQVVMKVHATESVMRYVEYSDGMVSGGCHWASLVVPMSVSTDMFLETPMEGAPAVNEGMVWKGETENHMAGPARVMREELIRIRSEKETGWREEEARECAVGHLKYMGEMFAAIS